MNGGMMRVEWEEEKNLTKVRELLGKLLCGESTTGREGKEEWISSRCDGIEIVVVVKEGRLGRIDLIT